MVTHPLQTCRRRERDPLRESADAQRRRRRLGLTRYTPITAANQPSSQPGAIAPPPPDELLTGPGVGVGVPTGLTVIVLPMESVWPTLSVTVKVTVTLPAALVSNVAVAVLMALVKLAMPAPLVIAHW